MAPASLVETILRQGEKGPGATLLRFIDDHGREESFDYARLRDEGLRCAAALAGAGARAGDPILLLFPDNQETVRAFLGAMFLGALPAIHPQGGDVRRGASKAIRRLVEEKGFRIATSAHGLAAFAENDEPLEGVGLPLAVLPMDGASAEGPFAAGEIRLPADQDPAYIQLSSGTTGAPKGIVISHGAIVRYALSVAEALSLPDDEMSVGWIPLFHDMGLVSHFLNSIVRGTPSVHIATGRWLRRPETLFQAVDRFRGTMTWMPNFAFAYCTRRVRDEDLAGLDLSCWRIVGNGAEPVVPAVMDAFAARFVPFGLPRDALVVGYGFAENVCGVTLTPPGRPLRVDSSVSHGIASCGPPRPGVLIRIADEAGRPLPERAVGRILVRSTTMFDGYLGSPEETRAGFDGDWFRSGDMGYMAEGELFVTGREKDLVIVGGRNVHPEAIEASAAGALGAASRIVAFGVPDGATEAVVLVCESKAQEEAERVRARRAVRNAVLAEMGIGLADIRFVPKGWIAKTTSGKTMRAACRRKYLEERAASTPVSTGDLERDVTELVERRLGVRGFARAGDLCATADSLQLASLFLEIEELVGRTLPWDEFLREPTLAHLLAMLRDSEAPRSEDEGAASPTERPARGSFVVRALRALPYEASRRVIARMAAHRQLRARAVRDKLPLLRRFYSLIERPAQDEEAYVRRAIAARAGRAIRDQALSRWRDGETPRWVRTRGLPVLERALGQGRGIIFLHSHFGAYEIAAKVVADAAGRNRMSVRKRDILRISSDAGRLQAGLVRQLLAGRRLLEHGGIVDIAGDGTIGGSAPFEVPFHGRLRPFRGGFAFLAESTGAAVIPVFSTIDDAGRITVELRDPLEAEGADAEERVRSHVGAYVALLEERWRRDPANVLPDAMREHVAMPTAHTATRPARRDPART